MLFACFKEWSYRERHKRHNRDGLADDTDFCEVGEERISKQIWGIGF